MKTLVRRLLGIALLAGLLPVAAVALPRGLEDLAFWVEDLGTESASVGGFVEVVEDPEFSISAQDLRGWERRDDRRVPPGQEKRLLDVATSSSPANTETTTQPTTTAPNSSTTTASKSSATTTSATTTSTSSRVQSDGTITGDACPCTVTGIVELSGQVNLQGDLIVNGGTLVARAGVDLQGNGYQIMFMNGGKADFQGTPTSTWSGDGSNANVVRDLNFRNLRRIIFQSGSGKSVLKYLTLSDSGTAAFDDYPFHWHLNGDSSRGTIVEGVVVLNGANHAFVPHGSNGITFKDTIAKNTRGDAYWWNDPGTNEGCSFQKFCTVDNSNDISYDHALVDGVTPMSGNKGFGLTGFKLGAGSGNSVRNSAAINIKPINVVDCSGFQWPEAANQNVGGNVWTFANNYSYSPSGCHGIFVWQNDGNRHVINGFNGGGIDHGAYVNNYEYVNVDVPYLEIHASGWKMVNSQVGTLYAKKHVSDSTPTVVLENVDVNLFVIQNAENGGDIPGVYVLDGSGLSCGDIVYESVVPGTKVILDGSEC